MNIQSNRMRHIDAGWKCEWSPQVAAGIPIAQTLTHTDKQNKATQLVVLRLPDNSLVVSFPDSDSRNIETETGLLREACRIAENAKARYIRCLLPVNEFVNRSDMLLAAGFHHVTRICRREFGGADVSRVCVPFDEQIQFRHLRLRMDQHSGQFEYEAIGTTGASVSMTMDVRRLLDEVMADSDDIPGLPTPCSDGVSSNWALLDSELTVLLASFENNSVGIVVCSTDPSPDQVMQRETLEFIGVRPTHRRRGIAAALLARLMDDRTKSASGAELTAYVDSENTPANALYDRFGFSTREQFELWLKTPRNVAVADDDGLPLGAFLAPNWQGEVIG